MGDRRAPVIWMIWDAAADWVTRALIAEGAMPALAQVATTGIRAGARPPAPNCQTPPSLATLFTGTWPWRHGISGFSVPDPAPDRPIIARRSGFERSLLAVEPIWEYAARSARQSVLVHVAWAFDAAGSAVSPGCVFAVNGYNQRVSRGDVLVLSELAANDRPMLTIGSECFAVTWDDRAVRCVYLPLRREYVLDLSEPEPEVVVEIGPGRAVWLSLMRRPSDNALLLISSGLWQVQTWPSGAIDAFHAATGPFVGEGLGFLYRQGRFGLRLIDGGDGSAERLLVRTIERAATYFERAALSALADHPDADLFICYQPCIDDIEHELLGWCDPCSRAYQPGIAGQAWATLRAVYQCADRHLAQVLRHIGPDSTIIISSDHGMAGMTHTIHVNEALAQAGLLAFAADGSVDLERTSIVYHPANNGSLWINDQQRPSGTVGPDQRAGVLERAVAVLCDLRDPGSGLPLLHAISRFTESQQGTQSVRLGDLFIAAADGYDFSATPAPAGEVICPTRKSASHATYPERAVLHGIFYARGPHLRQNCDLGTIDNRDVFPLVCHQLGIAIPNDREGQLQLDALH